MDRQAMEEARQARASRRGATDGSENAGGDRGNQTNDNSKATSASSSENKRGSNKDETKPPTGAPPGTAKKGIGGGRGAKEAPAGPLGPSPALPLPSLPEGRIGKLLVHRSGRVELRLLCRKKIETPASDEDSKEGEEREAEGEERMASDATSRVAAGDHKGKTKEKKTTKSVREDEDCGVCFEVNVGSECTFAQVRARLLTAPRTSLRTKASACSFLRGPKH